MYAHTHARARNTPKGKYDGFADGSLYCRVLEELEVERAHGLDSIRELELRDKSC